MTNNELLEKWYYAMWNKWDKDIFSEILDENITFRRGHWDKRRKAIMDYQNI